MEVYTEDFAMHRSFFVPGLMSVVLACLSGCNNSAGPSQAGKADSSAKASTAKPSPSSAAASDAGKLTSAREVLEKMAAAYHNAASYEDFGSLEYRDEPTRPQSERRQNFSVAYDRPNKIRVELLNGRVICNGKQWCGSCAMVPGQEVLRDAPAKISMDILRADYWLYVGLSDAGQITSPQLQLLLDADPIKSLVNGSEDITLDEPGKLGDFDCYRVRFAVPGGAGELWIDQKTFALRMYMLPLPTPPEAGQESGQPGRVWLVMNFERARLGGDIDPKAFQIPDRSDVKKVRMLLNAGPSELLGQTLPEFKFVDLQGKPWSSRSLAGKTAVIHFWRSDDAEGLPMAAQINRLHEAYKDNAKVAVLDVSLDYPEMPAKLIEDAAKQQGLSSLPMVRDDGIEARERLKIIGPRTTLIIDSKGVLQDSIIGYTPQATAAMPKKLQQILEGKDLARQARDEFQEQARVVEQAVDLTFAGEAQTTTVRRVEDTPAAKSAPKTLRLQPLWNCKLDADHQPGNLLVVQDTGGRPRIFVVDGVKAISEIGLDGKRLGTFTPKLAEDEFITSLRTAAGGLPGQPPAGPRYYAAFAPGQQRIHLFDEKFTHLLSYPADALENRHAGISDVALADLENDGVVKAYVGFFGAVGVKCVSVKGTAIWSCRNLFNVADVVPGPADAKGRRELYCANDATSVAILDARGQPRDAARLVSAGRLRGLACAALAGEGHAGWCGVVFVPDPQQTSGQFTALGLDESGNVRWKYGLPRGTQQTVEPIIVGRVLSGAASQWLLPGSDGSVHILSADGKLVDRFNYGAQINGMATVDVGGRPVLLISSANGVEALRVE